MVSIRQKIAAMKTSVSAGDFAKTIAAANLKVTKQKKRRVRLHKKKHKDPVYLAPPPFLDKLINKGWVWSGGEMAVDFWTMLAGTRQDKLIAAGDYMPMPSSAWMDLIQPVSSSTDPYFTTPTIDFGTGSMDWGLPSFEGVGKTLLIVGGVIAGVYLLGQFIKR